MTITIEIDSEIVVDSNVNPIYILMDALAEFQSNRGPTSREYVNKRYPDNLDYSWLDRESKIKEVDKRKIIAELMRNNIRIDEK